MDLLLVLLLIVAVLAIAGGVWLNPLVFLVLLVALVIAVASRGRYR